MKRMTGRRSAVVVAVTAAWCLAAPAAGQGVTGGLYGRVSDPEGGALPEVRVEIAGPGERWAAPTDAAGAFRFLKLDPGRYDLTARLDGWAPLRYLQIEIRAGRDTTLELVLTPSIRDEIVVDAASPLLDERELDQGVHVIEAELQSVPTARDPWALLTWAPGVLTDQVRIGGARAEQPTFTAPGTRARENDLLLDGVRTTDMVSGNGGSTTYFDFDQFEEIQVVTGGTDVSKFTAGVSINLVTRRGTNEPRASARYLLADEALQSSPDIDSGVFPAGQGQVPTNELESVENYGFELGGPLLRDRIWGWASWGRNDIVEREVTGWTDVTVLENTALKLNAQPWSASSLVASWSSGDKRKPDRIWLGLPGPGVATGVQRGPNDIAKLELSQVVGSRLFLTGSLSRMDGGFAHRARACGADGGCDQAPEPLWDSDGVVRGSQESGRVEKTSEQGAIDAFYFLSGGGRNHELRLGATYRDFADASVFVWPGGRNLLHVAGENFGLPLGPTEIIIAARGNPAPLKQSHTSVWLQDTVTGERWTGNFGLRVDLQEGEREAITQEANPAFPDLLTRVSAPAGDTSFSWETLSPRVGVTWTIGARRQALVRANYSRFSGALANRNLVTGYADDGAASAFFLFLDGDGDSRWTDEETDGIPTFLFGSGFDPDDPSALSNPDRIDPDLRPQVTEEFVLGFEHSPRPDLALGLHLSYRRTDDVFDRWNFVRDATGEVRLVRRDDYVFDATLEGQLPDGRLYSADFYALDPSLNFTGGSLLTNGEREVVYQGVALTAEKRLSDRWMLRGHVNYGRAKWKIPQSYLAHDDPTNETPWNIAGLAGSFDDDGDLFAERGTGGSFLQSDWSFHVSGLVQIAPEKSWGIDLSSNLWGRKGYPLPFDVAYSSRIDGRSRFAQATERLDSYRASDVYMVDIGVQKPIALPSGLELLLVADLFNALNRGTVLRREVGLNVPRAGFVEETLSPRIWRLGVRLSWH